MSVIQKTSFAYRVASNFGRCSSYDMPRTACGFWMSFAIMAFFYTVLVPLGCAFVLAISLCGPLALVLHFSHGLTLNDPANATGLMHVWIAFVQTSFVGWFGTIIALLTLGISDIGYRAYKKYQNVEKDQKDPVPGPIKTLYARFKDKYCPTVRYD